jgi:hypothetical protein
LPAISDFLSSVCDFFGFPGLNFTRFFGGDCVGGMVTFFIIDKIGNGVVNLFKDVNSSIEKKMRLMSLKSKYEDYLERVNLPNDQTYTEV